MTGQRATNCCRGWDLTWGLQVLNPTVFLSHGSSFCRESVGTCPEGGVEVESKGETCVLEAAGDVELGACLHW